MPYVQKIPNQLLRSEWATRIAQQLRIDEPVLRAALNKSAKERRSEVKVAPQLVGKPAKQIERRLIRMLAEAEGFKRELAQRLQQGRLHEGLETEKVFAALIVAGLLEGPISATEIGAQLEERERRVFFEILFEDAQEPTWEEAESCLEALRRRQIEQELAKVQRTIEANPTGASLRELLARKQELMKQLAAENRNWKIKYRKAEERGAAQGALAGKPALHFGIEIGAWARKLSPWLPLDH